METGVDAQLEQARRELTLARRQLKWTLTELEHSSEGLGRVRRQRARLREQNELLSDTLAAVLSEAYWSSRATPGLRGRLRPAPSDPEAELVREVEASELFDGGWYLRRYPKVAKARIAPALHYVRNANDQHTDPGPGFSTSLHLEKHPDAAASGLPALVHALRQGLA